MSGVVDGRAPEQVMEEAARQPGRTVSFSVLVKGMKDPVSCTLRLWHDGVMWCLLSTAEKPGEDWSRRHEVAVKAETDPPDYAEYMSTFTVTWEIMSDACLRIDIARRWRAVSLKLFDYEREWAMFCDIWKQFLGLGRENVANTYEDIILPEGARLWGKIVNTAEGFFAETSEGQMLSAAHDRNKSKARSKNKARKKKTKSA